MHIEEIYAELTEAMVRGDAAIIARTYYTEDAILFPPDAESAEGREGIEEVFKNMIEAEIVLEPEPEEVEVYGNSAYERGVATMRSRQGQVIGRVSYVVIWKRHNRTWRIYRDFVKNDGKPKPAKNRK